MANDMADIAKRKSEHLDIVLSNRARMQPSLTGFDDIKFEHVALPELDYGEIDVSTTFLGKSVKAPLLISSMTGGPEHAELINTNLALAAETLGIAFAVGSQRIALENVSSIGLNKELRQRAPTIPLLSNFGAVQLRDWDGTAMALKAVEMLEADALILHLNPLQEILQPEGDRNWSGLLLKIEQLAASADFPIVVKEVGAGISGNIALQLYNAGISIIDVAGAGGTSWAAVEGDRAKDKRTKNLANIFREWGIPTARAVADIRRNVPHATIIASGGIRHGQDAAKSIALGADMVGQAAGILASALKSPEAIVEQFEEFIEALKITCFCTGSRNLKSLRTARRL